MLRGKSHGHSHGGQACNHDHDHGHSHSHGGGGGSAHGHSHAAPAHGHTHGGQPCHGHGGGGHNHGASGPSGEALIALQQLQQLQAIAGKASLTECAKCQKPGSDCKLLMCGRCRSVAYCSVDHQREHWAEHKKVCPLLLKVAEHKAQVQKSIEAMKAMTFRSPHVHMQRVNENGRVGIMLRPLAEPQFQCFCHDSELHSPEIVVAYIKRDRFRQLQAHHQSGAKDWRKPASTAISSLFQPSVQFASSDASRDLRFSFIFYRRVDEDSKDNITVEFWSFPVKDRPLNSTTGTIVRLSAYVWNPTKAAEEKNQELVPVALTDSVCCGIGDVNVVADVQASACPAVPFQTIANFQKQIIAKRLGVPHNNDQALLEANDPQFNALHAKLGSMAREELDEPHYALVFVMQHVATCSGEEELCHSVMASKMHSQADDPTENDDEECDESDGGDHSGHNHSHGHGHSHGAGSHGHDHSHSHGAGGECDGDHKDSHPMIPKWMKFGTVSNLLNKLPGKTAPFTFVPESASQETDEALAATVVTAIEPKKGGADKKKKKKKGKKKQGAAAAEEEEGEDDEDETEPGAAAV